MHVVEPRQTDGGGAPSALAKPAAPPFVYSGRLAAHTVPQLERGELLGPGAAAAGPLLLTAGDSLGGMAAGGAPSATATGEAVSGSLALSEVLIVGNRNDQVCVASGLERNVSSEP